MVKDLSVAAMLTSSMKQQRLFAALKTIVNWQDYDKLKASDPDFYRAADSMAYGGAGKVPDANIDKMVAELSERYGSAFTPSHSYDSEVDDPFVPVLCSI